ncbi:hypothetical protein [Sideroxydans lithotrophicus]|uniref:Uncharacterized protein n=1 Tax=Sideroxydans lithotrophicus (strain ES-1) TaxID=580332 RepID=D5CLW8_SIDLE|nr:hypothetical protein [Sideroxydans lithotrophicus]ADE12563.1 hypothetical protein Slit_2336 [Sideroxydans lithotrophicus ES-1]
MAQGSYIIWTADKDGHPLGTLPTAAIPIVPPPDPMDPNATNIYFGVPVISTPPAPPPSAGAAISSTLSPPPNDQFELLQDIEKLLRAVNLIYLPVATQEKHRKEQFRPYYMRIFHLAKLGLEGPNAAPDISKSVLATVTADLIDDEAARVKNGHLKRLGKTAMWFSIPFCSLYVIAQLIPTDSVAVHYLAKLGVQLAVFANFMMLWLGCFVGVWLSYGIRTSIFTLTDLTVTDSDRLLPSIRLIFAGILTMILGLMFTLGVVQITLGTYPLTDLSSNNPMLAFLIGTFCGITELGLPAAVGKRASDFISKVK